MQSTLSFAASKGYAYLDNRRYWIGCREDGPIVHRFANNAKRTANPRFLYVWDDPETRSGFAYLDAADPDPSWQLVEI